ncbi:MAG: TonB-dependent receptor [Acidobacteria bacterium]|nr:TonB-dependent receptor [Acidobacteriota bacterium]
MRLLIAFVVACQLAVPHVGAAQTPSSSPVAGIVVDQSGGVVTGATVLVRQSGAADRRAVTGVNGQFSVDVPAQVPVELIVRATGFVESRQTIAAGAPRDQVRVALQAAGVAEAITVTATRSEQRLGAVPASVSVMDRADIQRSPAVVADDVLRRLPAFSLFRRTSSLSSHPTAQGVSLRGVGPSGVSRTLVLLDGVPFNDPFGGWVHWTRVPLDSADRIEVVDGASSNLYGNYAMGGVINIISRPAMPRSLEFRTQYGSWNSPKFDLRASDVWGRWSATVDVSSFDTEGFAVVAADERGPVDTKAAVQYANVNARLQYDVNDNVQAFVSGGYFREDRDNAKVSSINGEAEANSTRWQTMSAGIRARLSGGHEVQARVFGDSETFRSNFLAVTDAAGARSASRMSLEQRVPTTAFGALTQWSRAFGARHALSAGVDWRTVTGESQEQVLDFVRGETPVTLRESGGHQQSVGLFVQDIVSVTDALTVTLSARLDHWRNNEGHNDEISVATGNPTAGHRPSLPDRSDTVGSPRVAALYAVNDRVSVWGSVGAGFRAPTLNELYRQFRVGSVITLANHELGPERLVGGEAGIRVAPASDLSLRATWFDNRVTDPVSNVTISTGATVTQQRQNLGRTRIHGIQADAEYRPSANWRMSAGYLYSHATIKEFDANPLIVGNFLPQVPRHRGSIEVGYSNPRLVDVTLDIQAVGSQFDDDQNSRVVPGYSDPGLPKYALVSIHASRRISPTLDVFLGAQNLLDQQYFVGTLPTTIGTPRMVTAGVRVRVGGR